MPITTHSLTKMKKNPLIIELWTLKKNNINNNCN